MAARQGIETTLLYRRILAALTSVAKVSRDLLCTRLGIAEDMTAAAIKRLRQDGVIDEDLVVLQEHLQTVALPKYLKTGREAKRGREAADVAALVQGAGDMRIAEERAKRRKLSKTKENIKV